MTPSDQNATRDISSGSGTAKPRLIPIGNSNPGEYQLSKQTVTIGSHRSNDVVIDDNTVSRRHAIITRKTGRFELADLGSTNGSRITADTYRPLEVYTVVAVIYFVLLFPSTMLAQWYERNVVGGDGAFLEVANGFEDFARAMRRKLPASCFDFLIGRC